MIFIQKPLTYTKLQKQHKSLRKNIDRYKYKNFIK